MLPTQQAVTGWFGSIWRGDLTLPGLQDRPRFRPVLQETHHGQPLTLDPSR